MNGVMDNGESHARDGESWLLAGVMEHMACFLQTGRPKAAWLALLLLDRIAQDREANAVFKEHGQHLADALENKLAGIVPSPLHAERQVARRNSSSWSTREALGGSA